METFKLAIFNLMAGAILGGVFTWLFLGLMIKYYIQILTGAAIIGAVAVVLVNLTTTIGLAIKRSKEKKQLVNRALQNQAGR